MMNGTRGKKVLKQSFEMIYGCSVINKGYSWYVAVAMPYLNMVWIWGVINSYFAIQAAQIDVVRINGKRGAFQQKKIEILQRS